MPDAPFSSDVAPFLTPELLESLGDAVTLIDSRWRYVYASARAAEIIGRPVEEVVGRYVWELFPEVVGSPQHQACVRAMEYREREHITWYFELVGRWFEQYAIPTGNGLLILVNDITDQQMIGRRSEQLVAVGEALARAVTPEEVNQALIRDTFPLMGATGGGVLVADDERGIMRSIGWAGMDQVASSWQELPLDLRTPSTRAYNTGEPVYVADIDEARQGYPAIVPALEALGHRMVAALPLTSAGVRLGALMLLFPGGQVLTDADKQFLATTAAMAAQALLRAKLLDTERRSIAALQRSLLPTTVPAVEGLDLTVRYVAGDVTSEVGGDWYDVIPLEGGGVGLVMGDVEGHDLSAAALMGLCRSAVRAYALEGHPPAMVMYRANMFLTGLMLGRIVTLTYAHLHPVERLITVVSAGHPGIHVVGETGPVFEVPSEVGPPMGVYESGMWWAETSSTLPPHALFILFTDGLIEVRDEDLEQGLQRVRAVLSSQRAASVDSTADALLAARGFSSHDDVAVMTARLTADVTASRRLTRRLPPTPASAFLARRSCRQLLEEWSIAEEIVERAEIVVSELVSNAARHSEEPIEVGLSCSGQVVRLEVRDTSHRMLPEVPTADDIDPGATGGRGLLLIDTVATRWGISSDGLSKLIWAEIEPLAGESAPVA